MPLTLTIENEPNLPDGGPVTVTVSGKRGLDVGRDRHLDWTLPDPSRYISGKHCEVRFRDGEYWLTDVSTNGTYVNGSDVRVQSPYRLRNGDRLAIGHYIVRVDISAAPGEADAPSSLTTPPPSPEPPAALPPASVPAPSASPWQDASGAAPPAPVEDVRPPRPPASSATPFLDWAIDLPAPRAAEQPPAPAPEKPPVQEDLGWAAAPAPPVRGPVPDEPPAIPSPRRPAASEPLPVAVPPAAAEMPAAAAPLPSPFDAPPQPARHGGDAAILQRIAAGLGVPAETFAGRDPGDVAEQIGATLRMAADNLRQLLMARTQAKQLVRSGSHTMVQAVDNNPLKFSPSTQDALTAMFGPASASFMPADRAFAQSFSDLKSHQVKTYGAMQAALRRLEKDLSPASVEASIEPDKGISAMLGSRKARLWDVYTARWSAKTSNRDHGLVDAFMIEFSDCYDQQ
jgi:type VI secretion system protein ImpI